MTNALTTVEFLDRKYNFSWFKVMGVKAIVLPSNNTTSAPLFMKIVWTTGENDNTNEDSIRSDDNTKQIGLYNIKAKVFKFKPPNVILTATNTGVSYNYNDWISTDIPTTSLTCFLNYMQQTSNPIRINWEVLIRFRGARFVVPESRMADQVKYMTDISLNKISKIVEDEKSRRREDKIDEIEEDEMEDKKNIEDEIKELRKKIDNLKQI